MLEDGEKRHKNKDMTRYDLQVRDIMHNKTKNNFIETIY